MAWLPDSVSRPLGRIASFLPGWPWYVWTGLGAGVILLGGGVAAAATAAPGSGAPGGGPMPQISFGDFGEAVKTWQGVLGLPVDGHFDAAVLDATKTFQSAHGLFPDGVVGHDTWGAAGYAAVGPSPAPGGGGGGVPAPVPAPLPAPTGTNPFGLADGIPAREAQILDYVSSGSVDHQWVPLSWEKGGHTAQIDVSRRALALSDGTNRLPVNVSFGTAQKLADMLGGAMLTTRVSDEIAKQAALKIAPIIRPWSQDGTMAKTSRMLEQGEAIDSKVGGADGLVANEGKDWVLTRRFWLPPGGTGIEKPQGQSGSRHNAANFGWYQSSISHSPGNVSVVQSVGLAHDRSHSDYSQLARFMRPSSLLVDGAPADLAGVLADPNLSYLLQDEGGILPGIRHPDL